MSGNTRKLKRKKKTTISDVTKSFVVGDKVVINIKSEKKGAPHLRYQGRTGTVIQKMGNGYVIGMKQGGKYKKLVATSFHLKDSNHKR